jgi:hypothetical protein
LECTRGGASLRRPETPQSLPIGCQTPVNITGVNTVDLGAEKLFIEFHIDWNEWFDEPIEPEALTVLENEVDDIIA